jgi:uncharacterized protein
LNQYPKFVALQLLRAYKWAISPMLPAACRFVPTCSEYAMEAVERYGAFRGGWMALARILRCHPLGGSGYDPVVRENAIRIQTTAASSANLNHPQASSAFEQAH